MDEDQTRRTAFINDFNRQKRGFQSSEWNATTEAVVITGLQRKYQVNRSTLQQWLMTMSPGLEYLKVNGLASNGMFLTRSQQQPISNGTYQKPNTIPISQQINNFIDRSPDTTGQKSYSKLQVRALVDDYKHQLLVRKSPFTRTQRKLILELLCRRYEIPLRTAQNWIKEARSLNGNLELVDDIDDSHKEEIDYNSSEDSVLGANEDPMMKHLYDPERPDFQVFTGAFKLNSTIITNLQLKKPSTDQSKEQLQRNKNCPGYQRKTGIRLPSGVVKRWEWLQQLASLKELAPAQKQPFPQPTMTMLQRWGQHGYDIEQEVKETFKRIEFNKIQDLNGDTNQMRFQSMMKKIREKQLPQPLDLAIDLPSAKRSLCIDKIESKNIHSRIAFCMMRSELIREGKWPDYQVNEEASMKKPAAKDENVDFKSTQANSSVTHSLSCDNKQRSFKSPKSLFESNSMNEMKHFGELKPLNQIVSNESEGGVNTGQSNDIQTQDSSQCSEQEDIISEASFNEKNLGNHHEPSGERDSSQILQTSLSNGMGKLTDPCSMYNQVHEETTEVRKDDDLSSLEIAELVKRNVGTTNKLGAPGDPTIQSKTEEFIRFVLAQRICSPVYRLYPEKLRRQNGMWKHLDNDTVIYQNLEQMRLHYRGSNEKRFKDFISSNLKQGYLEDTGLMNIDTQKLQQLIDQYAQKKHVRVKKWQMTKKQRLYQIQNELTRMLIEMIRAKKDGSYETPDQQDERIMKEIQIEQAIRDQMIESTRVFDELAERKHVAEMDLAIIHKNIHTKEAVKAGYQLLFVRGKKSVITDDNAKRTVSCVLKDLQSIDEQLEQRARGTQVIKCRKKKFLLHNQSDWKLQQEQELHQRFKYSAIEKNDYPIGVPQLQYLTASSKKLSVEDQGFLYVFNGPEEDYGVRTSVLISQGYLVTKMIGEVTDSKDIRWGYVGNNFSVDAGTRGNMARYIKHNDNPNLIPLTLMVDSKPEVHLYALRSLTPHEQLTMSYTLKPSTELHLAFHEKAMKLMSLLGMHQRYYLRNYPLRYLPLRQGADAEPIGLQKPDQRECLICLKDLYQTHDNEPTTLFSCHTHRAHASCFSTYLEIGFLCPAHCTQVSRVSYQFDELLFLDHHKYDIARILNKKPEK